MTTVANCFVLFVAAPATSGILVKGSQSHNKYSYNTVAVVFLTECVKLIIATAIYLCSNTCRSLVYELVSNPRLFALYFIPSGLYCLYNNLAFVSLVNYDPTTYYIMLQLRMVVTGVMYEVVFKRRLSRMQWLSLFLITIGCLVKNGSSITASALSSQPLLSAGIFWILVQILCSCFAGVYTEFLVKDTGANVHLMVQNVFMYVDSIVCNFVGILLFPGDASSAESFFNRPLETFSRILSDPFVFMVMLNSALCGIMTSLFLKNFNSILKIFAYAVELVVTALICWPLFSIPIDSYTTAAILIVSLATYIYSQNPMTTPSAQSNVDSQSSNKYVLLENKV